ncbi:unnamed protein product [Rhizophagus irregularis]|nr:unnamed protein product [Rhizophagus irregularis]
MRLGKLLIIPQCNQIHQKDFIRRIFWHNAFELALRGGEHYNLKIQQFKKRKDGGIDVTFYRSKLKDRPPICEDAFYLQPCNNNEVEFTGYWFKLAQMGEKSVKGLMKEIATITESIVIKESSQIIVDEKPLFKFQKVKELVIMM